MFTGRYSEWPDFRHVSHALITPGTQSVRKNILSESGRNVIALFHGH